MRSFLLTRGLLAALVVTFFLLGGFAWPGTRTTVAAAGESSAKTITVTGQGQVLRTPDLATVHLGVETIGRTAQQAMEKNGAAMTAIVSYIKSLGIADKDIQTTGLSLYPISLRYPVVEQEGGTAPAEPAAPTAGPTTPDAVVPTPGPGAYPIPFVRGYRAVNQVQITVRDFSKVVWVIDGSVGAGATMVSGVNFGLADQSQAQREALVEAVHDARAKADALAGALGVSITGVQTASESSYFRGPFALPVTAPGGGDTATPVEPGELGVSATVTVAYTIG
ncbi:MAG TPA: SIMPL domain-containing protein [Dehalococcoidia bacterium]|nr:SIMPL domain-containing protein [Dehalococcoidia bacterium]